MTFLEIQKELQSMSGNRPEFYNSIIPGSLPALGVRVPNLRLLAQKIAKENYREFLDSYPMNYLEEEMLHVMVIGYAKDEPELLISYFEAFMPKIHDWCVNDTLCQGFKLARKYPKEVWKMLMKHKKTKKEFVSRAISVTLLSHFLVDTYIDKVIQVLDALNTDAYNSKMGVAWAMATILGKYPEKGLAYMESEENHLDKWTYNKSIQKAKESYRVNSELCEKLSALRRK